MVCYRYRKSDKRRLWLICGLLPGLLSPIKINEFIGLTKFCINRHNPVIHYNDVIMTTMASQITSLMVVYSTVYSDADQRKHQSSASLAFVWGIHRDRWIPRTKGQLRGNVSIWWRHHAFMTKGHPSWGRYFADGISECMFSMKSNIYLIQTARNVVPNDPTDNNQHWLRQWLDVEWAIFFIIN